MSRAIVVVTGAGSGIGRATVTRLAGDDHDVGLLDCDGDAVRAVERSLGTVNSHAVVADVSKAEQVYEAMEEFEAHLGTPTVLVNCAGMLKQTPFIDMSIEEWQRVIEVNLTGAFLCTQSVVRQLVAKQLPGLIINVTSVHADSPGVGLAHYDSSKGGLRMLTRSLALELAPLGIRVNSVAPGLVATNLAGGIDERQRAELEGRIPLGHAGRPEDIAGAISFLCSADAAYMTGAVLVVDGGMLLTAQT